MPKNKPELFRMLFEYFSDELDLYLLTGVIESVNTDEKTCVFIPDNGEPRVQNVRYVVNPSVTTGIHRIPKVGSQVTIGFLDVKNGNYAMIVDMQEFDSVVYDSGTDSVTAVAALTEKLNKLVDEVKDLKSKYEQHIHGVIIPSIGVTVVPATGIGSTAGGSTTTSAIVSTFKSKTINTFSKSDYEYSKIKIPILP
jgi:hypothetical protein